ncbi:MAG TPA: flavodoxin family protein [Methanoregulaceae archaeon]|nr:flavodoxin family protein [Methanoregulaceae archaeon]HRU80770.1 flavodoxin family protein [Methanolinea sp.]
MNILIIYKSYHRMNTEKVAMAMAEAMKVTLKKVEEVGPEDLAGYDLVGIGSGIYAGRYHKDLFELTENIPRLEKDVFIFSTAGKPDEKYDQPIKELLISKGCRIVGEFRCPGEVCPLGFNLNLKGGLGWLAGKNKGHPDEQDLERAREFAKNLVSG